MPVHLHLRFRLPAERRPALLAFLARAIPVYESPGGIRVRLHERRGAPGDGDVPASSEFIELVEYATEDAFVRDQRRVEEDPAMRALLAEWRAILGEAPRVEVFADVTHEARRRASSTDEMDETDLPPIIPAQAGISRD